MYAVSGVAGESSVSFVVKQLIICRLSSGWRQFTVSSIYLRTIVFVMLPCNRVKLTFVVSRRTMTFLDLFLHRVLRRLLWVILNKLHTPNVDKGFRQFSIPP